MSSGFILVRQDKAFEGVTLDCGNESFSLLSDILYTGVINLSGLTNDPIISSPNLSLCVRVMLVYVCFHDLVCLIVPKYLDTVWIGFKNKHILLLLNASNWSLQHIITCTHK